jgi:pyruvate dehydrogenase E1 component alpha subunit
MITNLTKQDLIDFEQDILQCFENKQIRAPVHLVGNNEEQLLEIFKDIREQDWVCCTWRSHYECLLKGIPPKKLKQKILDGHSISLCFKEYKIISSAIVAGICPIALGLAWVAKEQKKDEKVYCFIGDMAATTGIFHECWQYSVWHDLPITWVVADNGKSVCTLTQEVWNYEDHPSTIICNFPIIMVNKKNTKIIYYKYTNPFPHHGGKTRINF